MSRNLTSIWGPDKASELPNGRARVGRIVQTLPAGRFGQGVTYIELNDFVHNNKHFLTFFLAASMPKRKLPVRKRNNGP